MITMKRRLRQSEAGRLQLNIEIAAKYVAKMLKTAEKRELKFLLGKDTSWETKNLDIILENLSQMGVNRRNSKLIMAENNLHYDLCELMEN